jgi:HD-GYP domain-containing protein (c-di-GMP phosphodiesterase class II)
MAARDAGSRWLAHGAPVAAIAAAGAIVPALVLAAAGRRMLMPSAAFHVVAVGLAGGLALTAAVALSIAGARRNDGRAVLVGFAFSVIALLLFFHGLATPGVLVGPNGLVQLAGAVNLPLGGAILAASALPAMRRPAAPARLLRVQAAVLGILGAAGAVALIRPGVIPVLSPPTGALAVAELAVVAACLLPLAWRGARTYQLTRRPGDLLVTHGIVWLGAAEFGLLHFSMMHAGWWAAHALEVGGIALAAVPAMLDVRHGAASRPLVGDLRASELVEHEEAFLGGRVRALMVRLAAKDPSTEGHTRRVAALAVRIGEELGLPARRLRLLALGGLLHDMGKLRVPDAILTKPGRLTDEEFAVIRRHPAWGRELLTELGGFPPLVLRLVEAHHERLDGAGYPNLLSAEELELEVRILTVADVFDALTTDRVYREAMPVERALAILDEDTGRVFDADCVRALRGVLAPADAATPAWQAVLGVLADRPVGAPQTAGR